MVIIEIFQEVYVSLAIEIAVDALGGIVLTKERGA